MSEDSVETPQLPAPRWLSRAEKADFRRIEGQRAAAGKPLSATEVDAVADLVSARSRIADLRRLYRDAAREYRSSPYEPQAKLVLSIATRIDAATAAAQRQARRLGLGQVGEKE
ncbi:MAG: hypothetical protein EOQ28_04215 [Mesorhizobium sp.]|uniref:hypothetical protein n=1 Tax=Mesorhizobium sp. TaxID=1871066 RepID=UPI000FE5FC7F|nr:hypothetical protein [Mesorhizobium sp.]RWA76895.1 MAG: hypothetical protein EOQ28_04215 [Mesorhizobium sp.]